MTFSALEEKVQRFPEAPGVYIIRDAANRIIYVGKARSLKQRVRYYLSKNTENNPRLRSLQKQMRDIEYIVTDSEVEALILECNLIKENRPRYNIDFKDDKDYPYLLLTGELYPRLEILRLSQRKSRRGTRHPQPGAAELLFGPYTNAGAVRDTMRLLGKIFPLRRCRQPLSGEPAATRPCLNFQMHRCIAPCRGAAAVPPHEYAKLVEQVALFLEGRRGEVEKRLLKQMKEAAARQAFEQAALYRDQLDALREVLSQQQKVLAKSKGDSDVLALVRDEKETAVHMFKIREGKLLSTDHFLLTGAQDVADAEVLASFLQNYYSRGMRIPGEIILSVEPEDAELLQQWLQQQARSKVLLKVPVRGDRKKLVDLAKRNGMLRLQEAREEKLRRRELPLQELARLAGLPAAPRRIEGYDISHLQGGDAVGVMVVFMDGQPLKEAYRRFRLRQTPAGDDYAALREVLSRRWQKESWPPPDLVLIDGGAGQLGAALQVLSATGMEKPAVLALAKNPDRIFLPHREEPVLLPAHSTLLQLLQRIRDEAHRFAISAHRRLHHRQMSRSPLDNIPGIGDKRRAALLRYFGGMDGLFKASEEEISRVPGFNRTVARRVYSYLHEGSLSK